MPGGLRQFGGWLAQNRMQAVPTALVGLAGAATIGFAASGGQLGGAPAGAGGAFGGATSGAFSGALLGMGLGGGLMAAGMYSSALRPYVGKFIGKALTSRPMQSLASMAQSAPLGPQWAPAQRALGGFMRTVEKEFASPQAQAASFLIRLLENKQMQYRWAMGVGGVAGMVGGGLGGAAVGAWQGGSKLRGPMG